MPQSYARVPTERKGHPGASLVLRSPSKLPFILLSGEAWVMAFLAIMSRYVAMALGLLGTKTQFHAFRTQQNHDLT
jgi:hypothetical protein